MAAGNPFLDPGPELNAEVAKIVEALSKVSGALPASLQADPDSYYGCGDGLSAAETQERLLERAGHVAVLARAFGRHGLRLSPELIEGMHEGIFGPVFGARTLGYRTPPARGDHRVDDGVIYPIWVADSDGTPRMIPKRGAVAKQVRRRMAEACKDFERAVAVAESESESGHAEREVAARVMARLYVRMIRVHPFGDGNGRTAWAALQYSAGRLAYPFVPASPTMEARLALGEAIRRGDRDERLADYIRTVAWGG